MPIEYEAKILDVDPAEVERRILALGGRRVGEAVQRRYVYDLAPGDASRWVRLRDNGTEATLAVKEIGHDGIDGTVETETTVGDFATAAVLLEKLGYVAKSYQENRRTSFTVGAVECEIDRWPLIPPYLEIEGPSVDAVREVAGRLGYAAEQLVGWNTVKVYAHYGIELGRYSRLDFATVRAAR